MGKRKSKKKAEEVFHVEVITKARVAVPDPDDVGAEDNAEADWEYYVKWAGYESDANSWEPSKNVESCERLLSSFWNHVGIDNKDYFPGDEVSASEEWITMEKEFFAKEYQADQKRKKDEARKTKTKKRSKGSPSAPVASSSNVQKAEISEDESSESSAEEPSNAGALKIRLPPSNAKKRKTIVSSSSDEEPLSKASRPQKIAKLTEAGDTGDGHNEVINVPSSPNSLFSEAEEPTLAKNSKPVPTAKESFPPKKQGRRTNPQGRIASMAPSEIPATSGISTKQRLAQGALAPTAPKELMAQPTKSQPKPPVTNKSAYSGLNFKKRPPDMPRKERPSPTVSLPARNILHEPTLSSLNSPVEQSPSSSFLSPNVGFTSPAPPFLPRKPSLPESTVSPAMTYRPQAMEQVEDFLQSIMPASLAAPMSMETVESPIEPPPPKAVNPRIPLPGRIKKEWKWIGPLFLNSETALCNVKICNVTTATSLRFSMIFPENEKLEVLNLYDIRDIQCILSAFRKPSQMGQLGPSEETDTQPLNVIAKYLHQMHKAFLIPIILDDNVVGQVLYVSYNFYRDLFAEAPPEAYQTYPPGHIIAVILPYTLSQAQVQEYGPGKGPLVLHKTIRHTASDWKFLMRTNPEFQRALNMLKMPSKIMQYVGDTVYIHPYAIWTGRDAGVSQQKSKDALETRLLESILNQVGAKKVSGVRTDCRVLFVHAGALKTIHQLPDFVERRANMQHIHFCLYGSDPDIPPRLWSVTEIWPCGGIVTFSPSAMGSNPHGINNLISQINRHPLWACYILPSALGMAAAMECGTEDPLKVFDGRKLLIDMILQAIEDGAVALMEAPPEKPANKPDADPHAQWISKYLSFMAPTKRQALEMGVKACRIMQDPARGMEDEIAINMSHLHRHPAFIMDYRRYVVVCSENDDSKVNTSFNGFEWTTAAKFDFKDDFFPKQTIGNK